MAFLAPFAAVMGGAAAAGTVAAGLTASQMVAIGLTVVGGLVGAKADIEQGKMEARLHSENAKYAEQQAKDATARGVLEQDRIRFQLRRVLGTQRARYAAGGLEADSGTPLDVALDSEREAELDMLTARNNAAREAFGYRSQANRERMSGSFSKKKGKYGALGTLLTTGAQAYGIYKKGL